MEEKTTSTTAEERRAFQKTFAGYLAKFSTGLGIPITNNTIEKTIKQFLVISAVQSEYLPAAYAEIARDFSGMKLRSHGSLSIWTGRNSAPRYDKKFWNDLFQTADVGAINDIRLYKNFKELMDRPLERINEWQKALAFYLTSMKQKQGAYIGSKLISAEVGAAIDKFDELSEEEIAVGVGKMINALKFPQFVNAGFFYRIEDATETPVHTTQSVERENKSGAAFKVLEPVKWDTTTRRKYALSGVIARYRETRDLPRHYDGKRAFKDIVASIAASAPDWETISNEFGASSLGDAHAKSMDATRTDIREAVFGDKITSDNWMPFLAILDHCDLGDVIATDQVQAFIGACASAIPDDSFAVWSNVGIAKKFLTCQVPEWESLWKENWKLSQGLRRAVVSFKKHHPQLSTDTFDALRNL